MVKLVIGIVGAIGAGKDTAADYLVKKYGFVKFNTSDVLRAALREEGKVEFTREDMQEMSKRLRMEGRDVLTEKTLEKIYSSGEEAALILGIRLVDGIEYLRNKLRNKFFLLAVEVDQRKRFERKQDSIRSDDQDLQEWNEFKRSDDMEMRGDTGNSQEVGKVMALADMVIENDGRLEELYGRLDDLIAKSNELTVNNE